MQRAKAGDGWVEWRPQQEAASSKTSSSLPKDTQRCGNLTSSICSTYILARVHKDTHTEVFTKALSATTRTNKQKNWK